MEDFIDDDEEVDDNVLPMGREKSKKRMSRKAPRIFSLDFQEVQDMIGDVDDFFSLIGPTSPKQ